MSTSEISTTVIGKMEIFHFEYFIPSLKEFIQKLILINFSKITHIKIIK